LHTSVECYIFTVGDCPPVRSRFRNLQGFFVAYVPGERLYTTYVINFNTTYKF